jgi:glycine/D-amino acid oxidase-like deaminating enzyme
MAERPDVVVVGAGILGLASAYHILQARRHLSILIIDRLKGPGQGNTARSAAAFRDLFTSPVNRDLSQASIAFYDMVERESAPLDLKKIGYLWLLTTEKMESSRAALDSMADAGVKFILLEPRQLARLLPQLRLEDITQVILGLNCGILNPNRLAHFYEKQVEAWGGRFEYGVEATGFITDGKGDITGIQAGARQIVADTVIIATGAWMGATMALPGLEVPVVPRKRQLFSVAAQSEPLRSLLRAPGFNPYNRLPFTIMPEGAYLRPAAASFILGYANEDQPPGLEDRPTPEPEFFRCRLLPQVERYFPVFHGAAPDYAWAGHYADHPPDNLPFVDRVGGAIVVGGDSGSGIMKADSLGRIAAGKLFNQEMVKLANGRMFRVADLRLTERNLAPEEFII